MLSLNQIKRKEGNGNPKPEFRNPKKIRMTQIRTVAKCRYLSISDFGHSDLIRISDFGFLISVSGFGFPRPALSSLSR